ncbi:MAG: hypothetical protein SV201_11135, partial [Pseudomonadota bacterium]|nr:hypothetical protein [Pseudomonadota bacterium]
AVGSWQLAVGSWQLAVGSWQLAVGSWQLAVGSWQLAVGKTLIQGMFSVNCHLTSVNFAFLPTFPSELTNTRSDQSLQMTQVSPRGHSHKTFIRLSGICHLRVPSLLAGSYKEYPDYECHTPESVYQTHGGL